MWNRFWRRDHAQHPKWLRARYRLFRFRHRLRTLAAAPTTRRYLDLGCGDGEYLQRVSDLPIQAVGLDVAWGRLQAARRAGLTVLQASGVRLPFAAGAFDLIYVAHVLHHVADYPQALAEMARCLTPAGRLFIVETTSDHPVLRWGRRLHPYWRGDRVEADWRYATLRQVLTAAGFEVEEAGRFNLIFWLWEIAPLTFWPLELFTPLFVALDLVLARWLGRYAAHCYFVLRRPEAD